MIREKPELCKVRDAVVHRLGKGLQEGTAAGGAGFVQEDVVDCVVVDAEAFDILSADVNDEIDVGTEFLRRGIMRDRFDNAAVDAEGFFDDILAVAGDGRACKPDAGESFVDAGEIFADSRNGVSVIRLIHRIKNVAVCISDDSLDCRRACINAEIHIALRLCDILNMCGIFVMPFAESVIILL